MTLGLTLKFLVLLLILMKVSNVDVILMFYVTLMTEVQESHVNKHLIHKLSTLCIPLINLVPIYQCVLYRGIASTYFMFNLIR